MIGECSCPRQIGNGYERRVRYAVVVVVVVLDLLSLHCAVGNDHFSE